MLLSEDVNFSLPFSFWLILIKTILLQTTVHSTSKYNPKTVLKKSNFVKWRKYYYTSGKRVITQGHSKFHIYLHICFYMWLK